MNTDPEIGVTNEMEKKSETKETGHPSKRKKEQNIEEYIESLCRCLIKLATAVVDLLEFYKQVPPEVMKTKPMRKMQVAMMKLLYLQEDKQSSEKRQQQDSDDDPMLSDPKVKDCLEIVDKAMKAKRRLLMTMVAMEKPSRCISQESGEMGSGQPPAMSETRNPLVIECFREMNKAIEAKRRFLIELATP